jgi:hypothetical protein
MTLTKIIHDAATGEISEIELSASEISEIEAAQAAQAIENSARQAESAQKAADKAALLAQLGITEDQAKLLLS